MTGRERGLTLLEVLVALVLLALVSLLAMDGLRFGARAWEVARDAGATSQDVQIIQNQLRSYFAGSVARPPESAGAETRPAFKGAANSMSFVSAAPPSLSMGGLVRFTLGEEASNHGDRRLVLVLTPESNGFEDISEEELFARTVLLEGLAGVRFAYFGRAGADTQARWHDDWSTDARLPLLVRLSVDFSAGDGRRWPVLQLKPAEGPVYDPA